MKFRTNTMYLKEVKSFFRKVGVKPKMKILKKPPVSGCGKIVIIETKGFHPRKMLQEKIKLEEIMKEWQELHCGPY